MSRECPEIGKVCMMWGYGKCQFGETPETDDFNSLPPDCPHRADIENNKQEIEERNKEHNETRGVFVSFINYFQRGERKWR